MKRGLFDSRTNTINHNTTFLLSSSSCCPLNNKFTHWSSKYWKHNSSSSGPVLNLWSTISALSRLSEVGTSREVVMFYKHPSWEYIVFKKRILFWVLIHSLNMGTHIPKYIIHLFVFANGIPNLWLQVDLICSMNIYWTSIIYLALVELLDLANKNTGHPAKFKFQLNNGYSFA